MDEVDIAGVALFAASVIIFFFASIIRGHCKCCIIVRHQTFAVKERLGQFSQILEPGCHCLTPYYDAVRSMTWHTWDGNKATDSKEKFIDIRECCFDLPSQTVISRDNVQLTIHPLLYFRICSPIRALYETVDLPQAVSTILQTTLRGIIGNMSVDDTLSSREEINRTLCQKIYGICKNWGIELLGIEILEIDPTRSILGAMGKQLTAERQRRAAIISADGARLRKKTEAEGNSQRDLHIAEGYQKQSILLAESQATALYTIAKAEAESLKILYDALKQAPVILKNGESVVIDPAMYMLALKYINTLKKIIQTKPIDVIYPFNSDVGTTVITVLDDARKRISRDDIESKKK